MERRCICYEQLSRERKVLTHSHPPVQKMERKWSDENERRLGIEAEEEGRKGWTTSKK